jgi:hypothetical protein
VYAVPDVRERERRRVRVRERVRVERVPGRVRRPARRQRGDLRPRHEPVRPLLSRRCSYRVHTHVRCLTTTDGGASGAMLTISYCRQNANTQYAPSLPLFPTSLTLAGAASTTPPTSASPSPAARPASTSATTSRRTTRRRSSSCPARPATRTRSSRSRTSRRP